MTRCTLAWLSQGMAGTRQRTQAEHWGPSMQTEGTMTATGRTGSCTPRAQTLWLPRLPAGTQLLLHPPEQSTPFRELCLVCFCVGPSSPFCQPTRNNWWQLQHVPEHLLWDRVNPRSVIHHESPRRPWPPADPHMRPWSQFLLQSVTMGTEFSSEPQGVNQFTSHSLSEKNDDLGIYLEIEEWSFFSFI